MNPEIWGVFHDGSLVRIDGAVPGTVSLSIEIGYLRAMFDTPGKRFVVTLEGCTRLRYLPYDGSPFDDPAAIVAAELEIMGIGSAAPVLVDCVTGVLQLEYAGMSIALDSGEALDEARLFEACDAYWRRWSASRSIQEGAGEAGP
jgi:hypothetical protein